MSSTLAVVILAAGQGKRMKSALPKVLHPLAGQPMLHRVIRAAATLKPVVTCVVYGHGGETVRAACAEFATEWALQDPPQGTGDAVKCALPLIQQTDITIVLYGDVPLIAENTLEALVTHAQTGAIGWLTEIVDDATGLGRIVRNESGEPIAIVEHKDANEAQRAIKEINTGILAVPTRYLAAWLPELTPNNAQGEYYLTDILARAIAEGVPVKTHHATHAFEVVGVNSRVQLAELERTWQRHLATQLCEQGVSVVDVNRIDIRGTLTAATDVTIDINCIFEGTVSLDTGVKIGAHCVLKDCAIAEGTEVLPYTSIDGATVGANARIGPYARIRPGTSLAADVHIGNFVEVKASTVAEGSKANHLSYIGDSTVGKRVNIGAGTITCNYDGANKHRTVIEDGVHIGSDVQLVAPVNIGAGADIAAGTTVWKDVPAGGLTLNQKSQVRKADWQRPTKSTTKKN